MTLQNRVTPFGEIIATPERGAYMGNRGGRIHHNDRQELQTRRWASRQWITCLLEFKGRHRMVMQPNRYTELFFLDEVTAFAAGHRPCAECRRDDFSRFMTAWAIGNPEYVPDGRRLYAGDVDDVLQRERVTRERTQVTFERRLADLPDGTFVVRDGDAWLLRGGRLRRWTHAGYGESVEADGALTVVVLTPHSIVRAFHAGYAITFG